MDRAYLSTKTIGVRAVTIPNDNMYLLLQVKYVSLFFATFMKETIMLGASKPVHSSSIRSKRHDDSMVLLQRKTPYKCCLCLDFHPYSFVMMQHAKEPLRSGGQPHIEGGGLGCQPRLRVQHLTLLYDHLEVILS